MALRHYSYQCMQIGKYLFMYMHGWALCMRECIYIYIYIYEGGERAILSTVVIFGLRCLYMFMCVFLICVIVGWRCFFPGLILRGGFPFARANLHAGLSRVGDPVYRAHCSVVYVQCFS